MVDPPTNAFLSVSGLRCKGFSGDALPPPTNFYFVERGKDLPVGDQSCIERGCQALPVRQPTKSARGTVCRWYICGRGATRRPYNSRVLACGMRPPTSSLFGTPT